MISPTNFSPLPSKSIWHLPCAIAAIFVACATQAQTDQDNTAKEERWYQVELVVFSRSTAAQTQAQPEQQRRDIALSYPDNWVMLQSVQEYADAQLALELQRQQALDNEKFFSTFSQIDESQVVTERDTGGDSTELEETGQAEPGYESSNQNETAHRNDLIEKEDVKDSNALSTPPIEPLTPDYSELDPDAANLENQPNDEVEEQEPDYSQEPYLFLPEEERALTEQVNSLREDNTYTVLFHQSWRQAMLSQPEAPGLIVLGGSQFGSHRQLEGSIKISIARYLHLETQLWLSEFEPNYGQRQSQTGDPERETPWPELPPIPKRQEPEEAFTLSSADSFWQNPLTANSLLGSSDVNDIIAKPFLTRNIIKLKQKRRMRSKEIHYIDHPGLGLVITLTPYEPPQAEPGEIDQQLEHTVVSGEPG